MIDERELEVDLFLEHVGIKGMKWGVRRDRRMRRFAEAGKPNTPAATIRAVGGFFDPILSTGAARLGPVDFIRGHGIKSGINRKVLRVASREKRLQEGKGTAGDILRHYGSSRPSDLIPVRTKNIGKRNVLDNHKAVIAAASAVFVVGLLQKHAGERV